MSRVALATAGEVAALRYGAWTALAPYQGRLVDSTVEMRRSSQTVQIRGTATAAVPIGSVTTMFSIPAGWLPEADAVIASTRGPLLARPASPICPWGWLLAAGETIILSGSWHLK